MHDKLNARRQDATGAWLFERISNGDAFYSLISKAEGFHRHIEGARPRCRERPGATFDMRRMDLGDCQPLIRGRLMLKLNIEVAYPGSNPVPESVLNDLVVGLLSAE